MPRLAVLLIAILVSWPALAGDKSSLAPLRWNDNFRLRTLLEFEFVGTPYEKMAVDPGRQFAGHYVVVSTSCSPTIECGVLVDRDTGEMVAQLPNTIGGYLYSPSDNWLVVSQQAFTDKQLTTKRMLWDAQTKRWCVTDRFTTDLPPAVAKPEVKVVLPSEVALPISR